MGLGELDVVAVRADVDLEPVEFVTGHEQAGFETLGPAPGRVLPRLQHAGTAESGEVQGGKAIPDHRLAIFWRVVGRNLSSSQS